MPERTAADFPILGELERIDRLIRAQVDRARALQSPDSDLRGLVISEQEVDDLLDRSAGLPRWASAGLPDSSDSSVQTRRAVSIEGKISRISSRLEQLARMFDLTPFDQDVLLLLLAPEMDLRYERLYAYLQDDVTRRYASADLVLNMLSPSLAGKLENRARLALTAPLLAHEMVHWVDDPARAHASRLGRGLRMDERILEFLLGSDEPDARLLSYARVVMPLRRLDELLLPSDLTLRLDAIARRRQPAPVFYLHGPRGVGKKSTAEALCREQGLKLLVLRGEAMAALEASSFAELARAAVREAQLQGSALYWAGLDSYLPEEKRPLLDVLIGELESCPCLIFLAGGSAWIPMGALTDRRFVDVEIPSPNARERAAYWSRFLDGLLPDPDALDGAVRFRLTTGQIRDAVATAHNLAYTRSPEKPRITRDDINKACRLHSNRNLARLARAIIPHYTWPDIVLPADRMEQLDEICDAMRYRSLVYEDWGFERRLALGRGLNVLFAGPSGTGKTMAAEIIAGELGLDLYKIDLSTVVSKYIGETEKNLARIFAEAETSNAILFFDEADALFGKRSEVRDAHDRYANVEISYLLQKMEEYEGMVVLATNLRKNMDEAFVRRMHMTVDFPFPAEEDRRRIWQRIWHPDTPLGPDLDLDWMARRFELAGGSIRNIALAAAFLAAADGRVVTMLHLLRATRREYQKMGQVVVGDPLADEA